MREVPPNYPQEDIKPEDPSRRDFLSGGGFLKRLNEPIVETEVSEDVARKLEDMFKSETGRRKMIKALGTILAAALGSRLFGNIGRWLEGGYRSRNQENRIRDLEDGVEYLRAQREERMKEGEQMIMQEETDREIEKGDEEDEDQSAKNEEEIIRDILKPNIERPLIINDETTELLRRYFFSEYQKPYGQADLNRIFREMAPLKNRLKEIFSANGSPEQYMYLAITESRWRPKGCSKRELVNGKRLNIAAGYYQLTYDTAKQYGVIRDEGVIKKIPVRNKQRKLEYVKKRIQVEKDYRANPLESGKACAKIMKHLLERSGGDRGLALSGYNGAIVWEYLKKCYNVRGELIKKPKYSEYQELLSEKIEKKRRSILNQKFLTYSIREGDVLSKIKKFYRLDGEMWNKFLKVNGFNMGSVVKKGQNVRIPLDAEGRQLAFERAVEGFIQNLKYPAKFDALMDEIDRRNKKWGGLLARK